MSSTSDKSTILIDGRAALRSEVGGVERWAREMTVRLQAGDPESYKVLKPPKALAHRVGHLWEQSVLPAKVIASGAKILYSPANSFPLLTGSKAVVHIPDVAPLRNPGWYSPTYITWQRLFLKQAAARALHIVTGSEFAKSEITALLKVSEERVSVVAGGVSSSFNQGCSGSDAQRKFDLSRPYVLTVGSVFARKNLELLTECADRLDSRGIDLVVAGGSRGHLKQVDGLDNLRILGYVSDELLPSLYAGSEVFVFPSKYEGFGLPCLEAMATGVPIAAATGSALPEVCGEAGSYFDPSSKSEAADVVESLLDSSSLRQKKVSFGLERVAEFSWQSAAEKIDALLKSL